MVGEHCRSVCMCLFKYKVAANVKLIYYFAKLFAR